jgi:hypothetical protein
MIIALAFILLTTFSQAIANTTDDSITSLPVELKIVGTLDEGPILQLNFSGSKDENEFSISISDEAGILLYSDKVKGEIFSKKFLLNRAELGDTELRFIITGTKSRKTAVYKVSSQHKIIEQMDVVKL